MFLPLVRRIVVAGTTLGLAALPVAQDRKSDQAPAKVDRPAPRPLKGSNERHVPQPPRLLPGRPGRDPGIAAAKLPAADAGVVAFTAAMDPPAVAPGGAGTMTVVMALTGDAVLPEPPPAKFTFAGRQGALLVTGQPTFRPAESPGSAPALKGLPCYDDFAIFDVPFTVDAAAPIGVHELEVAIQFELWNGQKGGLIGRFLDPVSAQVTVARTVAESTAGADAGAQSPAPTDGGSDAMVSTAAAGAAGSTGIGGGGDGGDPAATAPVAGTDAAGGREPGGPSFVLLLAGVGAIVALLAIVLASRSRS